MDEDLNAAKKKIRKLVTDLRRDQDIIRRGTMDEAILNTVCSLKEYKEADTVLLYVSYNGEADTLRLIDKCINDGKTVACPKCVFKGDVPALDFYVISGRNDLKEGYKGIPEPDTQRCRRLDTWDGKKTLIVVPMVAYDPKGNRIGYGKGFYDRFLAEHGDTFNVAIAYSCQEVDSIPVDKYDIRPALIINENGIVGQ